MDEDGLLKKELEGFNLKLDYLVHKFFFTWGMRTCIYFLWAWRVPWAEKHAQLKKGLVKRKKKSLVIHLLAKQTGNHQE